jgi:FkbM family methyltransferase
MTGTTRAVAEGANRFRHPGIVERLVESIARLPIGPSIRRQLKRIYRVALTIQTAGRGLARHLPGGEVIRVFPRYDYITWNPDEYRAFREAVRPGMVALDIGANVGAYATLLGQWVGPTGRVFAFEPAPGAFQGLTQHVRLNDLSEKVTPVCAAVGSSSSTVRLLSDAATGESRLAVASDVGRPATPVRVTTIDEFCARESIAPDFIKIDVEGSELDALRGARETIRKRRGKLALFVEMHPSVWPAIGVRKEDIEAELRHQGLAARSLTAAADTWTVEGICLRLIPVSPAPNDRD